MSTAAQWERPERAPEAAATETIYDLTAMAVAGFALRTSLKAGGTVHVILGESEGVTGQIRSTPADTHIDAQTPAYLTLNRVHADTEHSTVDVDTALVLQKVAVDIVIPKGGPATGRAQADHLSAPKVTLAGLDGVDAPTLRNVVALGVDVRLDRDRTTVTVRTMTVQQLDLATPKGAVTLADIEVENLVIEMPRNGKPVVSVGTVKSGELVGPLPSGSVGLRGLALQNVGLASSGAVTVHTASCDAITATWRRPATRDPVEHKVPGPVQVPVDLSFLDGLDGHMRANLTAHVRIPIIPDWRADHEIRVDVRDGAISYERLERGIGKLPDAVLDFNLNDDRLCFDKDIPLVPFDRKTLLSWPLPREEDKALARQGRIRLALLARPHIEIERKPTGKDKGARFLQEIRIRDIDVALSLAADAGMALPAGGTLRLGGLGPDAAPPIERATLRGELVMRPDDRNPIGSLLLEAVGIAAGLSGIPLGERRLDVGTVGCRRVSAEVRTRDFTVHQIHAALSSIEIEGVSVTTA